MGAKAYGGFVKGRTPTKEERELWDRIAAYGCVACRKDGWHNPVVSIHHIDGRTKPGAHRRVLPLCAGHHQDGTGISGLIAVHPLRARFEAKYGRQDDLLSEVMAAIS
jgi:hypothetical protein